MYVTWLQSLPCSRLGSFFPFAWEVLLGYGLIGSLVAFFIIKRFRYLILAFLVAVGLTSFSLVRWDHQWSQKAVIVYSIRGRRVLSLIKGRRALLLRDGPLDEKSRVYQREVLPSIEAMGVHDVIFCPYHVKGFRVGDQLYFRAWKGTQLIDWQGYRIVCLDEKSGVPPRLVQREAIDLLLVDRYPMATLKLWLSQIAPQVVVLGHGLTWRQRKKFKKELQEKGIAYHDLQEEGALVADG